MRIDPTLRDNRRMDSDPPRPAPDTAAAEWLISRTDLFGENWVAGTVGSGFDAYARIFHPLDDDPGGPRWADVAASHRRTMHASAQWEHISAAVHPGESTDRGRGYPGEPLIGNLTKNALAALSTLLAGHTTTPDECWFAVWNGWGWQHPGAHFVTRATPIGQPAPPVKHATSDRQLDLTGPQFSLPGRAYHLFTGPIDTALHIGHWVTADWFDPQSPSIFWPTDHAWCVATEIDYDSTLVGGTRELVIDITNSPHLESLPIAPDAPYQDTVNV